MDICRTSAGIECAVALQSRLEAPSAEGCSKIADSIGRAASLLPVHVQLILNYQQQPFHSVHIVVHGMSPLQLIVSSCKHVSKCRN